MARDLGIDMGFISLGKCRECGELTFAADGVCSNCREEAEEADLRAAAKAMRREGFAFGLDCE